MPIKNRPCASMLTFETRKDSPRITPISRMGKIIYEALSRSIIGVGMEVLNELKPGLDEKLYERAMAIELRRAASPRPCKVPFPYSIAAR